MCEIEIRIVYIKKHVYKDRKETYIITIYIRIKYNVYNKMVTRPVYKRLM